MAVCLLLRWNFLLLSWNVCCLPLGLWGDAYEDWLHLSSTRFVDYNKPWQPHDDSGIEYSPPYLDPLYYSEPTELGVELPHDVEPAPYSDSYLFYSEPIEPPYLEPTLPPSLPEPLVYPELPAYPEPGALTQLEVNLEHGSSETEEQSSELPPWLYSEEGQYVSPVGPVPPNPLYPGNYAHNLIGQIPGTISHFSTEYEEGRDHWQDDRYERYDVPPYPPKASRGPAHPPKIPTRPAHPPKIPTRPAHPPKIPTRPAHPPKIPTRPAHPPKIPTRPAHPPKVSSYSESSQKLLDDPVNFIPDWVDGAKKLAPGRPLPSSVPSYSEVGQLLGKPAGFIQAFKSERPSWLKKVKSY